MCEKGEFRVRAGCGVISLFNRSEQFYYFEVKRWNWVALVSTSQPIELRYRDFAPIRKHGDCLECTNF